MKIGDSVEIINCDMWEELIRKVGVICGIDERGDPQIGVDFGERIEGLHFCDDSCKSEQGWYFHESDLKLIQPDPYVINGWKYFTGFTTEEAKEYIGTLVRYGNRLHDVIINRKGKLTDVFNGESCPFKIRNNIDYAFIGVPLKPEPEVKITIDGEPASQELHDKVIEIMEAGE